MQKSFSVNHLESVNDLNSYIDGSCDGKALLIFLKQVFKGVGQKVYDHEESLILDSVVVHFTDAILK